MAAKEPKIKQEINHARINYYLEVIQKQVSSSPMTRETMLLQLLNQYVLSSSVSRLFKQRKKTNKPIAETLRANLNNDGFDLKQLDDYLADRTLDKKGDFFSLMVAWLFYYEDTSADLSALPHLENQLIIPLLVFKKERLQADIDLCFKQMKSADPIQAGQACLALGRLPMPEAQTREIIRLLVPMMKTPSPTYPAIPFDTLLKTLSSLPIPEDMSEEIIDLSIKLIKKATRRERKLKKTNLYHCDAIYELLNNITIPQSRLLELMHVLQERIIKNPGDASKTAWELIQQSGSTDQKVLDRIDLILDAIDSELSVSVPNMPKVSNLVVRLSAYPIPDKRKNYIIRLVFDVIDQLPKDVQSPMVMASAFMAIKACLPLSNTEHNNLVINKLLHINASGPAFYDLFRLLQADEKYQPSIIHRFLATPNVADLKAIKKIPFCLKAQHYFARKLIALVYADTNGRLPIEFLQTISELGIPKTGIPDDFMDVFLNKIQTLLPTISDPGSLLKGLVIIRSLPKPMTDIQSKLLTDLCAKIEIEKLSEPGIQALKELDIPASIIEQLIDNALNRLKIKGAPEQDYNHLLIYIHHFAKELDPSAITRIQIMLDHIQSVRKDPFLTLQLAPFHYQLEQLKGQKQFLDAHELPKEIVSHILGFIEAYARPDNNPPEDNAPSAPCSSSSRP